MGAPPRRRPFSSAAVSRGLAVHHAVGVDVELLAFGPDARRRNMLDLDWTRDPSATAVLCS